MGDRPRRPGQRDVDRVGMAAKVICTFKQRHRTFAHALFLQGMGGSKTRNARPDDGNFHASQPK